MSWTNPIDFNDRSVAHIESDRPLTPYPLSLFRGKTMADWRDWFEWQQRWHQSPEGHDYLSRRVSLGVALASDGSFRFDDVPPGEYRLCIRVNGEATFHVATMGRRDSGPFSHIIRTFTVPPVPGGRSEEPLDLGGTGWNGGVRSKSARRHRRLRSRQLTARSSRCRGISGKFVLIDFGTLWDIQATQIALLNEENQRFGKDPRFAILSLTFGVIPP